MSFVAWLSAAWLPVCAVALGLLAGMLGARRSRRSPGEVWAWIRQRRIRHGGILVTGAGAYVLVNTGIDLPGGRFVMAVSLAMLVFSCVLNRHIVGATIMGVGFGLTLLVLLLNGYLPVDPAAIVSAGYVDADPIGRVALGAGRRWADADTALGVLGAAIPLSPFIQQVTSIGDLIAIVGLMNVTFRLVTPAAAQLSAAGFSARQMFDTAPVISFPAAPVGLDDAPIGVEEEGVRLLTTAELRPNAAPAAWSAPTGHAPAGHDPGSADAEPLAPWPQPAVAGDATPRLPVSPGVPSSHGAPVPVDAVPAQTAAPVSASVPAAASAPTGAAQSADARSAASGITGDRIGGQPEPTVVQFDGLEPTRPMSALAAQRQHERRTAADRSVEASASTPWQQWDADPA